MDEATLNIFGRLGISLVIGMLVGLQREYVSTSLAGLRTFALISLAGTLSALIDRHFDSGGWILAASLITVGAMIVGSQWQLRHNQSDTGMTTPIAIVVVFCIGAYLADGETVVAVAAGVAVAALLQFKPELHWVVHKLGDRDIKAIIQFAVFSCVILPVLPNREMGPLNVINPFNIWLMVVLIVGIGLASYIAYKFFGESAGVLVGGFLGGAISSTATTMSYSKRSRVAPSTIGVSTAVIVIAASVVFARVLIEISVVAPGHFAQLGIPIVWMLASCSLAATIAYFLYRGKNEELPDATNPSEFKSAIMFGGLYVLVLWGLAAAKEYLGNDAMYGVAALSGLTDMDAITLSTGRMVEQSDGEMNSDIGWRLLITAAISNLLFKAGMVAVIGGRRLFVRVFALFMVPIICGGLLLAFWR